MRASIPPQLILTLLKFAAAIAIVLGLSWSQICVADSYVFAAPPSESAGVAKKLFNPIADHLTKATGRRFTYRHSPNWLSYMRDMRAGRFDLVFDGPHFVSWRISELGHTPLVRLQGTLEFVIVARDNDEIVFDVKDLAGHKVCTHAPPDLGTVIMQSEFKNPVRQPQIFEVNGFDNIFAALVLGRCRGAVIPFASYAAFNSGDVKGSTRILYLSEPLPREAISAGPRIPLDIQGVIRATLLSPLGLIATQGLREGYADGGQLVATDKAEYQGFASLLNNVYGFSR